MSSFVRQFYFSARGRTGRRFFWLFGFIPLAALGLLLAIVAPNLPPLALLSAFAVARLLTVWTGIAVFAKRLHDMGLSAWWMVVMSMVSMAVGYFVSVLAGQLSGIAMWAILGIVPGMSGVNRFGPDPTRPRGNKRLKRAHLQPPDKKMRRPR